jgi:hypothetical protein
MDWLELIIGVSTILATNYGLMKFLLRDTHRQVEILEKEHQDFKQEMRHVNNRLDGIYRIILDRTYGKNIPEDLKADL